MENKEIQKHLLYITKLKVQNFHCSVFRGVTATWKNDTAHISFYFEKNPTEKELEEASDICTEIIASMPRGIMKENYIVLKFPLPLPIDNLAYERLPCN